MKVIFKRGNIFMNHIRKISEPIQILSPAPFISKLFILSSFNIYTQKDYSQNWKRSLRRLLMMSTNAPDRCEPN